MIDFKSPNYNQNAISEHSQEDEISLQKDFDYSGYQVVHGDFFSRFSEPNISFYNYIIYVNSACIKKLQNTNFIQILINPETKKMVIRPSKENAKDSFRWCNAKSVPKRIVCKIFFSKVMELMKWNLNCRYRLTGKAIQTDQDILLIFDLNTPEIFVYPAPKDGQKKNHWIETFPIEWKDQFGIPAKQHKDDLHIDVFDKYALFSIQQKEQSENTDSETKC